MAKVLFSSWTEEVIDNRGKEPVELKDVNLPEEFNGKKVKAFMGWNGFILTESEISVVELCKTLDYEMA